MLFNIHTNIKMLKPVCVSVALSKANQLTYLDEIWLENSGSNISYFFQTSTPKRSEI